MLANLEPITGGRQAEVFSQMLGELPWPSLRNYVQVNAQISKVCLLGGYRLEPKHRKRFEQLIVKEAEKAEFNQPFCNPVFAQWYPVHQELYKQLEDYLHSDIYKTYRSEQGLGEDVYVLPDDVFTTMFAPADLEKWRILLFFSPLQFNKEQSDKILSNEGANEVLLKRSRTLEETVEELRRENARLVSELERGKTQTEGGAAELQELRRAKRDLLNEKTELQNKFEVSQKENSRIRQVLAQKEQDSQQQSSQLEVTRQQERTRLADAVQKLEKELADWRSRYEAQRAEDRELKRVIQDLEGQVAQERATVAKRDVRIQEYSGFADLILAKIDWAKIGKELHLTPALQRQFNSVMKKLHYEEDMTLVMPEVLATFWQKLVQSESVLIQQVVESNTQEVMNGTADEFWAALKEPFEDVIIGMEARLMLLKLMEEIFFELFDTDDLEVDVLPKRVASAKKQ